MVKKSEFIWNTLGSLIGSVLNAVVLLFCTRFNGTEAAGIFSIAYATAMIFNAIGDYGIRIYQVTDSKRKYPFGEYLATRIVTLGIMLIGGIIFVLIQGYEFEKLIVCIALILFKIIDDISDTYQAEFQLQGRLDIAGKSLVLRGVLAIATFFMVDFVTKNLVLSTISMVIVNLVLFLLYDLKLIHSFTEYTLKFEKKVVGTILKDCFPLFSSTILSMYINNAVKYAIDKHGNYEMQTCYNIIYLPTFTINMATMLIIKPLMKNMGEYWNNKEYKKFISLVGKTAFIMLGLTVLVELVCATIALPILSFIYHVDVSMYKLELLILVVSGFFYGISTLLLYTLGAMRRQGFCMIAYVATSVLCLILPNILVEKMGMMGTAISNLSINLFLVLILTGVFIYFYIRDKEKKED